MLDRVIRVTDHDPAGRPALAAANRIRVAAKRADVVENPFLMTTLFLHVLDQGILIALVRSARRGQSQQGKRMFDVVICFGQKIEVEAAPRPIPERAPYQRNGEESLSAVAGLGEKLLVEAHVWAFRLRVKI